MPTNDEIKQKLKRENPARVWELDEPALTNALDEARADTAKQIFKELDKFILEHDNGNSENLEDFIFQSLEYSDKDEEEIAKEDYLELKKKYKVD